MEALIADRLSLFWRLMAAVGLVMAFLTYRYLWLLGRGYVAHPGRPAGVRGVLAAALRTPPGGWALWLRHLWWDGLLHRRLWHTDRLRWGAHQAMLFGFLGLALLSLLAALSDHVFRPLALDPPFIAALRDKDQPFLAALHETLGFLVLLGGLTAALRRRSRRAPYLPNERPDRIVIGLLLLVTASGYPLESLRLLMEQVPPAVARYSYLAWPLARLVEPLGLDWAAWHFWAFQAHVLASVALFVYWPFSKMMHVFVAPLTAAQGASEVGPTR